MSRPLRVALNLNNRAVAQQEGSTFTGRAPDLARALGAVLGCQVQLVCYPDAGAVVADVQDGWDLANRDRLIPCDTAQEAVTAFQASHAPVLAGLREGLGNLRLTATRILPDDFATIPQAVDIPLNNAAMSAKVEKAIQAFRAKTKA